jgi:selenocysteine lyase/cysteine desulfurase
LDRLADEIRPTTHTVAFSLVQALDGRVADVDAVAAAAAAAGARTVCDLTQAAGWMPVDASRLDVTVCATYKWLSAPRGTAFLTVRPERLHELRPTSANWYAGEEIWSSVYGPHMALAGDARRLDVSPAWLCWVGAAPVLELFADASGDDVRRHAVGLADSFRAGLGMAPGGSAIVALADDAAGSRRALLAAQGTRAAGRGGGVRLAFHVWNDADDVARAVAALSNS